MNTTKPSEETKTQTEAVEKISEQNRLFQASFEGQECKYEKKLEGKWHFLSSYHMPGM